MRQTLNRWKALIRLDRVGWLLILVGIVLRLRQYFENLSISGDEAGLARNIVDRTLVGFTQRLDYNCSAQIVFLFIEKLSILAFGNTDLVLRLFPLLSSLLAMFFIYLIGGDYLGMAGRFAVFAFTISSPLIFYSSYLKPYSSDVVSGLILLFLSVRCLYANARIRDLFLLGAAGVVTIWISHPSVFVLAAMGLMLAFKETFKKDYRRPGSGNWSRLFHTLARTGRRATLSVYQAVAMPLTASPYITA